MEVVEFHKLLREISRLAHSEASKTAILDICPLPEKKEIEIRLGLIQEIRKVANQGNPIRFMLFSDLHDLIRRVRTEGVVLDSIELSGFIPVLSMAREISLQITDGNNLPLLSEMTADVTGCPDIQHALEKSVDSEGNILDSASHTLADLRKDIRRLEHNINKKLEALMREQTTSVFLQDVFVTKRAGRWVIPVRMDAKGEVPGVVHDVSKSGETAFIEPLGIINLSNELENLIAEAKGEEIRILRSLSSAVRERADEVLHDYNVIVYLDALNCIATFADRFSMQPSLINTNGVMSLIAARHPLLSLAFSKADDKKPVVPLTVRLGDESRVMVITGSNAGGKTIAIKTVGLLLLMSLSGMPVPADSSSSFPLVKRLLVDIGDEQSIESSLSTFSAHVAHLAEILDKGDADAVVLIDELGTGTDPDEGTALSCVVLKEIHRSGALVFATTHLNGIKSFIHVTDGMVNASMEFDQDSHAPLYRLRTGEPGQSHALEIARQYGLSERIIHSAREMMGRVKVEFDSLIADLHRKRSHYEAVLEEAARGKKEIETDKTMLAEVLKKAEEQRKKVLADAHKEALKIITDAKVLLHRELDDLKRKDKEALRRSIKNIEEQGRQLSEKIREHEEYFEQIAADTVSKGDTVFVRPLGHDATVVDMNLRLGRVKVRSGGLEIDVPVSEIGRVSGKQSPHESAHMRTSYKADVAVSSRLHVIGLRVDEALSMLEPFLNHAVLAGLPEVTIIHGMGKGLLAKAVQEHLTGHPLIKTFRSGKQEEGGAGVTVGVLK
jgi:DNA mismatch repair protein MutS2